MHVFSKGTLREFWKVNPKAKEVLKAWHADVSSAIWKKPTELRNSYATVSILKDNRAVFNIKGNEYRIVVRINYDRGWVYIRFVGTHAEYDKIDADTI
jgi:mRNA interferase HigB